MVERYNAAAHDSGLPPQQANAVVGNICVQDGIPEALLAPEYFDFDIAAIGLGLHHFESPPLALRRLAERLRVESGVLLIVDFLPLEEGARGTHQGHGPQSHQNHPHQNEGHRAPAHHHHGHSHHSGHDHQAHAHAIPTTGFSIQDMQKLYEDAGVGADFEFDVLRESAVMGDHEGARQRQLFIAKGRRASAKL